MSLSDILKGASLPKLPAIVEEASQAKAENTKKTAALDAAQQSFLADTRTSVTQEIKEYRAQGERIRKEIGLMLNRPHRASWASLWALVNELSKFDLTPPSVVVFGGWHRKADCPKPADSDLLADVQGLRIFGEMLRRIDPCYDISNSQSQREQAIDEAWRWKDDHEWAFEKSHCRSIAELREYSQCCAGGLTQEIQAHFLYAQENALIFYPSPCDLNAGWKEFLEFTRGFNYLPVDVIKSIGPFFLIMQTPN
jgi:hypothetical protein